MSENELVPLTPDEAAELEGLQEKCLKEDGGFRIFALKVDKDRLLELEARIPEPGDNTGDETETPPPPPKEPPKPAGPSFRIDGVDPYGMGALRCLNKLLAAQGKGPACLPLVLEPDKSGNALAVLANYRLRCRGAGTQDAVRLKAVDAAIVKFGGKLEEPKKAKPKKR